MKKILFYLPLSLLVLILCVCVTACKDDPPVDPTVPPSPTEVDYTVTVVDYQNQPLTDVVVKFFKDGQQLKMLPVDANGKATLAKQIPGNYTVSLVSLGGACYYDEAKCAFSDTVTALTVTMYRQFDPQKSTKLYDDYGIAYALEEGAFYATLVPGKINYFTFLPDRTGTFSFGVVSGDENLTVGDYGSEYIIRSESATKPVDGKISLVVQPYHLGSSPDTTTHYLVGVDARNSTATGCIVALERVGDPPYDETLMPWTTITPTPAELSRPEFYDYINWKRTFHNLPLAEKLTVVFNEADGYYHYGSIDGPIIMVLIDRANPYVSSFVEMCDGARLGAYIYDENGNLVRKEDFNTLIHAYAEAADKYGAFPLNAQLAYMIKTVGEYKKWWDMSSNRNIFDGFSVNIENAWLFACGYYTITKDAAVADNPGQITGDSPERALQTPDTTLYFSPVLSSDGTLSFTGLAADTVVYLGETAYTAVDGKLTLRLTLGGETNLRVVTGATAADYTMTLTLDPLPDTGTNK